MHYISCALYFYYCYISSTSDHQHQILEVGDPCIRKATSKEISWPARCSQVSTAEPNAETPGSTKSASFHRFTVSVLVTQLCPTLCDPMECSLPGPSVHGTLQERVLEWVAISFSGGSSWPRDGTCVPWIGRQILYHLSHQSSPQVHRRPQLQLHDTEATPGHPLLCPAKFASSPPVQSKNRLLFLPASSESPKLLFPVSALWWLSLISIQYLFLSPSPGQGLSQHPGYKGDQDKLTSKSLPSANGGRTVS